MDVLRRPDLMAIFRIKFFANDNNTRHGTFEPGVSPEGSSDPAYPLVQQMRSSLYFESANGFGEWRILIATRAEKSLRQARKKDGNTFKVIVKKIR